MSRAHCCQGTPWQLHYASVFHSFCGSGAILNFLSRKYGKGTSWWPEDDEIAARVVEYGMWHGGTNGLQRAGVSWVFPAVS